MGITWTRCATAALAALIPTLAAAETTALVNPDGSYATVPLEKSEIVVKVVQNGVRNL